MANVKLTFVGAGDAFGSGGRVQTCILIEGPTTKFAIDFATSSLIGLRRAAKGVDLLIAESYFYDKAVPWHLNYPDIRHLDARRIVLTHMHTNKLEQTDYVVEECAHDGYAITI